VYKDSEKQLKIVEFELPFAGELSPHNRWVLLSGLIPWDLVEKEYLTFVSKKLGAPVCSARMAFGALIIKERMGLSDIETVESIMENPYLQYFVGLKKFKLEKPFDSSMMVKFRKRFLSKSLKEINEEMHRREVLEKKAQQEPDDDDSGDHTDGTPPSQEEGSQEKETGERKVENKGKLLLDATAVPADITYPNDIKLLNSARQATEKIIDELYYISPKNIEKPRTYRVNGRKEYVVFSRKRRHSASDIRKTRRKQLGYVERNLKTIKMLNKHASLEVLDNQLYKLLLVSSEVARQQRILYDQNSIQIDDRIVNIFQPHIRPIKRGKVHAPTEFGAKLSIAVVDGYTFIDNMSFDNYNESRDLIASAEAYKAHFGYYPESIHADKIYRCRANIKWCNGHNIRLSGPKLGRPAKLSYEEAELQKKLMRQDELDRIPVEGKFGQMKRRFGLDRIMTKLAQTTMTVISLTVFITNLEKLYKVALIFATICIGKTNKTLFLSFLYFLKHIFANNETIDYNEMIAMSF